MANVRVKICGITRIEDALAAAAAGADAIGLVFYARSPRVVSAAQARRIVAALPPFVTSVGLFVDASPCEIEETLDAVPLDLLQVHGDESPAQCARYRRPYIKALRMHEDIDLAAFARTYAGARGLLLDTYVAGVPGGTGQAFDWTRVPRDLALPLIVAGGLAADNIATAIATSRPYGVDVSGGVEQAKGIKDATEIARFVAAVRGASVA